MKQYLRYITAGLAISIMALAVFPPTAAAAEATPRESITLSPVNKRYQLDAGSTTTDEITIVNDGETSYDFILYARPYSIHNNAYDKPDFTTAATNGDAYQWIQFNQSRYHIKAGQTLKVGYTMRVPAAAAPGGHYGVLFAETQPTDAQAGSSVARKKRVGMIMYATVKGEYEIAGQYDNFAMSFLQFHAPLVAHLQVKNDGNSDFVATTAYKVMDILGRVKYQESKEYAILPQTKRDMTLSWQSAPWFGLYRVEGTTSFLDQKHSASQFVLIAPRWLLITSVLVIAGGVLYAVLRRRR